MDIVNESSAFANLPDLRELSWASVSDNSAGPD
jgi:hypothetical protein